MCSDEDITKTISDLLEKSIDENSEIITLYLGKDSTNETTEFIKI